MEVIRIFCKKVLVLLMFDYYLDLTLVIICLIWVGLLAPNCESHLAESIELSSFGTFFLSFVRYEQFGQLKLVSFSDYIL